MFERSARRIGLFNLSLAVSALIGAYIFHNMVQPSEILSYSFAGAVWVAAALVSVFLIWRGIRIWRSSGRWKVRLSEETFEYIAPEYRKSQSFCLSLDSIRHTEVRSRAPRNNSLFKERYVMVTDSGEEIQLSRRGGLNVTRLLAELEVLGIPSFRKVP